MKLINYLFFFNKKKFTKKGRSPDILKNERE